MTIDTVILLLVVALLLLLLFYLHQLSLRQERLRQTVLQQRDSLFNQFESYHFLRDRLGLRQGLPYTRDWSAAPDFLKLIVEHCLEQRPQTIVECSSGLTSLVLARCCELNGTGHLYSLENGADYAAKSRAELQRHGLTKQATVLDAPLQRYELSGTGYQWYSRDGLPDTPIEMLVIDGPPGFLQRHSRYPALPLLYDRLADGCVIFLDDAARPDEQEIVSWWQAHYSGLRLDYVKNERGCAVLTVSK